MIEKLKPRQRLPSFCDVTVTSAKWSRRPIKLPSCPIGHGGMVGKMNAVESGVNRTDRLFAMTVLLQQQKRLRAVDLARRFDISERTVYRDILALNESGIPIVSIPGFGYELMEGYVLPPLTFTPQEARSLFLAGELLKSQSTGQLARDLTQALAKLTVVLPERVREETEHFVKAMRVMPFQTRFDLDDPKLATLYEAIQERRVVRLAYHSYKENRLTERDVEPLELSLAEGSWYLHGFCRLRGGHRAFRLNRIESLRLLWETFAPRKEATVKPPKQRLEILFEESVVRWVRERQHYGFASEKPHKKGVVMVYTVEELNDIVPWLLGWGKRAKPLSPPEFKERVKRELSDMLR
jgi:predicted DNA-binding transcriptional regulator YafY